MASGDRDLALAYSVIQVGFKKKNSERPGSSYMVAFLQCPPEPTRLVINIQVSSRRTSAVVKTSSYAACCILVAFVLIRI
jgi:hypothetical protein